MDAEAILDLDVEDGFSFNPEPQSPPHQKRLKRLKRVNENGRRKEESSSIGDFDQIDDAVNVQLKSCNSSVPRSDLKTRGTSELHDELERHSDFDCASEEILEISVEKEMAEVDERLPEALANDSEKPEMHTYPEQTDMNGTEPISTEGFSGDNSGSAGEAVGNATDGLQELDPSYLKKNKRKPPEDKPNASSKAPKKPRKSDLEELHSESQRLLRETPNASFKPEPVVQKPVSSVLEKIRLRKQQLQKKNLEEFTQVNFDSTEDTLSPKNNLAVYDGGDQPRDPELDNSSSGEKKEVLGTTASFHDTDELNLKDIDESQDVSRTVEIRYNGGFRPPILDSEDPLCDSCPSYKEEETAVNENKRENENDSSKPYKMNLKLDSQSGDEELPYEDDNKENVDPSPSQALKNDFYNKGSPVKAFVDDEAEDEDEDGIIRHGEDDDSEDEQSEDLKDLIATAEEAESESAKRRRDELHRKWLEQQDDVETDDILLRLGGSKNQRGAYARKTALLEEIDDTFEGTRGILDENENSSNFLFHDSRHCNDDVSSLETKSFKVNEDESDKYVSSDDDELEETLMQQKLLQESEEQETFTSPVEDETSREIFGLIKKENVAPVKRKPKSTSTFHEIVGTAGDSNTSSRSSFLGRVVSSSLQVSHKQGLSASRSYIFGRDDSNGRYSISNSKCQEEKEKVEHNHLAPDEHAKVLSQSKPKHDSVKKISENETSSGTGFSLFEILRRRSLELHKRGDTGISEKKQSFDLSHLAIKSLRFKKTTK